MQPVRLYGCCALILGGVLKCQRYTFVEDSCSEEAETYMQRGVFVKVFFFSCYLKCSFPSSAFPNPGVSAYGDSTHKHTKRRVNLTRQLLLQCVVVIPVKTTPSFFQNDVVQLWGTRKDIPVMVILAIEERVSECVCGFPWSFIPSVLLLFGSLGHGDDVILAKVTLK